MSGQYALSRRRLAQLAAAMMAALPRLAGAQAFDQGIGGTGVVGDPKDAPSDQNIGGTGVVGTIRRFGSIYVNGLRISYPDTLQVSWSGTRRGAKAMKIGHVVQVAAASSPGGLVARSIAIQHEVVGPVDSIGPDGVSVLGQTVSLSELTDTPQLAVGQRVAVSGLRRIDGTISASLIEEAPAGPVRVTGPLLRASDGSLRVGALTVTSVDPALLGQRVTLIGRSTREGLTVTGAVAEHTTLSKMDVRRVSLEAYVASEGDRIRLGSGLQIAGDVTAPSTEVLAILTLSVEPGRETLRVETVETETPSATPTRGTRDRERGTRSQDGRSGHDGEGSSSRGRGGGKGR